MSVFKTIPFFRILIPFLVGVLAAIELNTPGIDIKWFILIFIILFLVKILVKSNLVSKFLLLFIVDCFFVFFGNNLVHIQTTSENPLYYGNLLKSDSAIQFIATVNDLPIEKEKTIKCNLTVLSVKKKHEHINVKGDLIVYLKKSLKNKQIKAGSTLAIKVKLMPVSEPKNPFEFNYKQYLNYKQIYHTAFLDSSNYEFVFIPNTISFIWQLGLKCKLYILNSLQHSLLNKNSYSICAALLTGYDDEIDKSVMEAFSHSGTLHVLSVSGLHTGLIFLVLSFLFDLVDRKKRFKLIKFFWITIVLWLFALITGFSAPVLRAVIMFNLLGIGKIYFRSDYRNQINILLFSAFILLSYNPYFIKDIGFLLSYFALFGILYYQPIFSNWWKPNSIVLKNIWQSITASFSATISTLPITLFAFKQFPIWFFICNIVVVPITFIVLLLAFFVVIHIPFADVSINFLIQYLIIFIDFFNSANFGFIDKIDFNLIDSICLAILIVFLSLSIRQKSYKKLIISFSLIIIWQFISLIDSYDSKNKSQLTIYHLKNASVFGLKNKEKVIFNVYDILNYNYHIKPHLISFNYINVEYKTFNFIKVNNFSVLILSNQKCWPKTDLEKVNSIILCNNVKLSPKDIKLFPILSMIVLDGSNNSYNIKKTEELCRKFAIKFYSTKTMGAAQIALK